MVRPVQLKDAAAIVEIYNYYILHTVVTFEEITIDKTEMERRIEGVYHHFPWLVYEKGQKVVGYAYASEWNKRSAYKNSVECTIYLKYDETGKGIGSSLYKELFKRLIENGGSCHYWWNFFT